MSVFLQSVHSTHTDWSIQKYTSHSSVAHLLQRTPQPWAARSLLWSQIQPTQLPQLSNYMPHYRGSFCSIKVFCHCSTQISVFWIMQGWMLVSSNGRSIMNGMVLYWMECCLYRLKDSFSLVPSVMVVSALKMNPFPARLGYPRLLTMWDY